MDKSNEKGAAGQGGKPKKNLVKKTTHYSTDTNHQRNLIFNWLQVSPLTTVQARQELDVLHPAARVQELREQGHNIVTHWETADTGKGRHRVASYVLFAAGENHG